ncbi:MAG: efflux RND transporter periplasmic adaptor subunit [Lactobacillaceae bacterium]|jgi:HlyD family secretion protein|nr:efflux RND transporter periplasmic adaptor subunit [Lactobacillaceae bacterium]
MKKLIVIILLIVLAAVYLFSADKKKDLYITEKLKVGGIIEKVTATGIIDPISTINVGTQVSGTVKEIYVDYNSEVTEGQLLAIIDPSLFEAKVKQQRANLNSSKAQVKVYESQKVYNEKNLERIKQLNERKFASDKDLDLAQKEYDVSIAQLELQKANVEQISAALHSAEIDLNYTRIVSPVKGIIVSKDVEVGQTVAASFQTPTLFQVAEDLSKMQINAAVVETDVAKVEEGQKVEFTVDGFQDQIFEGRVIQVRNNPTTTQNVVSYEVIIEISNSDLKFKPGMTANVDIITAEKDDILIASNKALRFFITDDKGEVKRYKDKGLWVLDKDKNPKRISVKTGISDDDMTEVIYSNGEIKDGVEVVVEKQTAEEAKNSRMRMRLR